MPEMVAFISSHQLPLSFLSFFWTLFKGSVTKPNKITTVWTRPWTCSLLHAAKWMSNNNSRALPPAPFPLLMYRVLLYFSWACALFHQSWSFPEVSGNHPSEIPRESRWNITLRSCRFTGNLFDSSLDTFMSPSWKLFQYQLKSLEKYNLKMNENFTYSGRNN